MTSGAAQRAESAPPASLPSVQRFRWAAATAVLAAVLVTLVVVVVAYPDWAAPSEDTGAAIVRSTAIAALLLVFAAASATVYWRFRLEVLAWRPGPINVLAFEEGRSAARAAPGATDQPASDAVSLRDLHAMFETALVNCRFSGVTAVPTTGRSTDFLSVVEEAGNDLRGAWGAATRFVRLLGPASAYEVRCVRLDRRDEGDWVLLVEVSRIGRSRGTQVTVTADSAQRVVDRAAHAVAARILPRTRQCSSAPWTLWAGQDLPIDLFDAYQRFGVQRADRHTDGAMRALREAIREDPRNIALRLDLGKLQERLQLYLDALLTYDDIITVAASGDRRLAAWWGTPVGPSRQPPLQMGSLWGSPPIRRLHRGDPVIMIARYRHALLLGLSEQLADQWWGRSERCTSGRHQSGREARRAYLREALAVRLADRYPDIVWDRTSPDRNVIVRRLDGKGGEPVDATDSVPEWLGRLENTQTLDERADMTAMARVFFSTASQLECEHLVDDYVPVRTWTRPKVVRPRSIENWVVAKPYVMFDRRPRAGTWRHRRRREAVLPREALIALLPWASMRRAMALSHASKQLAEDTHATPPVGMAAMAVIDRNRGRFPGAFRGSKDVIGNSWPADVKELRTVMRRVTGRHDFPLLTWRAHYNAACTLALPLLPDRRPAVPSAGPSTEEQPDTAAAAAVGELERAVMCADGRQLARQRDWLLSEDPDLDRLRGHREFQHFEATTFGSIRNAGRRGPDIRQWEQSAYVAVFIAKAARLMAVNWESRSATTDVEALLRWLDEETMSWELAERLAIDHRDAHTRDEIAARLAQWQRPTDLAMEPEPHPQFSERLLDHQLASLQGDLRTSLLTTQLTVDTRPVVIRVDRAIKLSNERLAAFADGLRLPGDPETLGSDCCSLGRTQVLTAEEIHLRAYVPRIVSSSEELRSSFVESWRDVSVRRWTALAVLFDDKALGVPWEKRQEDLTKALRTRWWSADHHGRHTGGR